jgi:hypothetical protein
MREHRQIPIYIYAYTSFMALPGRLLALSFHLVTFLRLVTAPLVLRFSRGGRVSEPARLPASLWRQTESIHFPTTWPGRSPRYSPSPLPFSSPSHEIRRTRILPSGFEFAREPISRACRKFESRISARQP